MQDADVDERFMVVVNDEEQYSLWAEGRALPAGWRGDGFTGTRAECLAHIEEVWTDQRPLSVRRGAAA
ncbi:MbtH family NRPS accessory protein [Streptomyces sp. NPDC046203]|uniref:MbtH family protein n=1 Tax=Streptomyces sp. NPDC046203 TaxID=3154602 RepID=UPI0033EED2E9